MRMWQNFSVRHSYSTWLVCSLGLVASTDTSSSPQNSNGNFMQLNITVLEHGKLQPFNFSIPNQIYDVLLLKKKKLKILFCLLCRKHLRSAGVLHLVVNRGLSFCFFQVLIQNKKIDLSHVTSKCGSLDNIHHRPGQFALVMKENKGRQWRTIG